MPLDLTEIVTRIGLAFVSGFILGLERESHGRPAGLRTIVLVCVASAIAAVLSDQYYRDSFIGAYTSRNWHPDPARLAAGILTGIGFLGAGVIIHQQNLIRGVTTASQIWFVTILGLCFGGGQYVIGLIGLGISIVTVYFLRKFEFLITRNSYATLTVTLAHDGTRLVDIVQAVEAFGVYIRNTGLERNIQEKKDTMEFALRFKKGDENKMSEQVITAVTALKGVIAARWK
jgi:putative Mg2+ transporter-C (MgtC) family protein